MKAFLPLLAVALALPAAAQTPQPAEAAALEYIAAMQSADWDRTAALTHPEALVELKNVFAMLAQVDTAGEMLRPYFGVSDDVEFDRLRPTEVYARLMRHLASDPLVSQAMRSLRAEVVGSIPEGADTVHVLYRMHTQLEETRVRKLEILSLRRAGDRWLALLTGDLRGLADSITGAIGAP